MKYWHLSFLFAILVAFAAMWELNHQARIGWVIYDVCACVLNLCIGHWARMRDLSAEA